MTKYLVIAFVIVLTCSCKKKDTLQVPSYPDSVLVPLVNDTPKSPISFLDHQLYVEDSAGNGMHKISFRPDGFPISSYHNIEDRIMHVGHLYEYEVGSLIPVKVDYYDTTGYCACAYYFKRKSDTLLEIYSNIQDASTHYVINSAGQLESSYYNFGVLTGPDGWWSLKGYDRSSTYTYVGSNLSVITKTDVRSGTSETIKFNYNSEGKVASIESVELKKVTHFTYKNGLLSSYYHVKNSVTTKDTEYFYSDENYLTHYIKYNHWSGSGDVTFKVRPYKFTAQPVYLDPIAQYKYPYLKLRLL